MDYGFECAIKWGGLETEQCYPYEASTDTCNMDEHQSCVTAKISGYKDIPKGSDQSMMVGVSNQPISIGICASGKSFQFYSGGIYNDNSCSSDPRQLDHGVLLVGYGTERGQGFYKVKNSWGNSWGEQGYIRMARGEEYNMCGILNAGSFPVV